MKFFFLALGMVALPVCGQAQVVVHQAALDQLAGLTPVTAAPVVSHVVAHRTARRLKVVRRVAVGPSSDVVRPVVASPPSPPVVKAVARPGLAAPGPALGGAAVPPVAQPVVAKPAPMVAGVTGGTVVLRFAAGDDALPGDARAALQPVCAAAKSGGFVAIDAFAPTDKDDPSAAMRLSLSRAFTVRDALTGCGVPAARIIPRADGAAGDGLTARITIAQGKAN